jgi:hypothetical protein
MVASLFGTRSQWCVQLLSCLRCLPVTFTVADTMIFFSAAAHAVRWFQPAPVASATGLNATARAKMLLRLRPMLDLFYSYGLAQVTGQPVVGCRRVMRASNIR